MPTELTGEAWAQIRHDYEHTDRPVEEICAEHGISSGTLRDRMRRWNWTRRRPPIPFEGPPAPAPDSAAHLTPHPIEAVEGPARPSPHSPSKMGVNALLSGEGANPEAVLPDAAATSEDHDSAIVLRLQSALARVLPAIEATVATLAAGPQHPRDMERAARALPALVRTLRELNSLLSQRQAAAASARADHSAPEDLDEMRRELARRIHAFVDERTGQTSGGAAATDEAPAAAEPRER